MRVRLSSLVALLSLPALTAPAWAKNQTADIRLDKPATIEGISLQPGKYHIIVYEEGTEVKFIRDGKIVAYVLANWVRLDRKAEHSALLLSGDAVDEIDFAGKEMAITFQLSVEQGAATNAQRGNENGESTLLRRLR
jgi:hypothetical protein